MKYPVKRIGLKHLDWSGLVLTTDLPSLSKLLALYLCRFMNKDQDVAWPSRSRMEEELSISRGALNKHLDLLEAEGWISRQRGDSKTNTRYHITFPKKIEKVVHEVNQGSSPNELRSSPDELEVVHEVNTNRQLNRQTNSKGRFTPPTLQEVRDYINEKSLKIDPEKFYNHYESSNWYRGKTKIKNWKACTRTWTNGSGNQKTYGDDGI